MSPGRNVKMQAMNIRLSTKHALGTARMVAGCAVVAAGWAIPSAAWAQVESDASTLDQWAAIETTAEALADTAASQQRQLSVQSQADQQAQPIPDARPARKIDFEADELSYDNGSDTVIASGNVVFQSGDRSVRADEVRWDRTSGIIIASGNVRSVDERGNQLFTERLELSDEFETGEIEDLLIALRAGGRLAARSGERGEDGVIAMNDAAYSACGTVDVAECERPSWRITAKRVAFDPEENMVSFKGAVLELFGARILPMPGLAIRTDGRATAGFLVPDLRISESNGLEVSAEYYTRLADNKDLTLGTFLYTEVNPMLSAQWRHLTSKGAYQITGYATHSRRISDFTGVPTTESDPRGYVFANGKFQLSPEWSVTGSVRVASDRTFLRRYDISRDDRLRSTVNIERIDDGSYLSFAGWATQSLRLGTPQGQIPVVLPVLDYRKRLADPIVGGNVELQLNSLNLVRDEGQDTQRAFAGARWDLRHLTGMGQVITLTGLSRADVYHTSSTLLTETEIYRGTAGWQARGVALGAIDIEWPFVGKAFGGTQVIKPRVQFVATPPIRNLNIPNEDARAFDLEDSNLFALNRFPGYDRVEDGARLTYGLDWELLRPGWKIKSTVGQSYRFSRSPEIFPNGTGLSGRASDFVGRTEIQFENLVKFTHRYRLDKDSFAIRRNEFDATVGSPRTYAEIGYLRLNRNITDFEDLQDREELRAAGRVGFARYWSMFGSGVFNLTDQDEDPTFVSDGFEPIRTRLGVAYEDDSLEFGITWRRDFVTSGDAQRGDTFQLFFRLRNLGFR